MREAQKPDHVGLNSLLTRLKDGRYAVPDFQRDFEWKARDIRDLMRSIFLDYYIGSLLLWKGNAEHYRDLSCTPLYARPEGKPEYVVLDGQQRLTAINYAFVAPDIKLPTRANRALYFVRVDQFMAEQYDDAFDFWYVAPGRGDGVVGFGQIYGGAQRQFANHIFPLAIVGSGGWDLSNWVQGYNAYWNKQAVDAENDDHRAAATVHAQNAVAFGEHLKSITETFQISYIELDKDLPLDKVCDIFTQINSKGVRLDVFDLLNALLKPKGVQLKAMWHTAQPRLSFIERGKVNVYILQVMSILRQTYSSPKYLYYLLPGVERKIRIGDGSFHTQVMVPDAANFSARWDAAVKALENAIARLRHPHEFGVTKSDYLPYFAILPVFAAALAEVKAQPAENQLAAEGRFRLWYWASIFTNRYSASSETTAARDIQDLRTWFADGAAEPALIAEFRNRVPALDLRGQVKKGDAIYNGVFNLLVIQGAKDWINGMVPQSDELDDHHIVPKSWGAKHLGGNAVDTILNRTPLTSDTNRKIIGDRLPNTYLPELIKKNSRETVEALMATHFVSPAALDILLRQPFEPEDFAAFVTERQRTITYAIQSLLIGGRADLPPDLRGLDEAVEQIELCLRTLIATRLNDDLGEVPSHVRQKMDPKIAAELKRNPGSDPDRYKPLLHALEFADITELLSIMTASGEQRFKDVFPTNDLLVTRFGQLCGLRNPIRHSRTVSEIARHDGEAAIKWFEQALASPLQT